MNYNNDDDDDDNDNLNVGKCKLAAIFSSCKSGAMAFAKITGETPEVRSDKRKPRILLRHRTP